METIELSQEELRLCFHFLNVQEYKLGDAMRMLPIVSKFQQKIKVVEPPKEEPVLPIPAKEKSN